MVATLRIRFQTVTFLARANFLVSAPFRLENSGEGRTYHETPPPMIRFPPPPPCSHFLRGNGHRPDQSYSLSPTKPVLVARSIVRSPQNHTIRFSPPTCGFPNFRGSERGLAGGGSQLLLLTSGFFKRWFWERVVMSLPQNRGFLTKTAKMTSLHSKRVSHR